VNLASVLAASGRAAALREGFRGRARTWVFSPVARTVRLSLGLDYRRALRLNGQMVLDVQSPRGPPRVDRYRAKAALRAGWNRLSVHVASGSRGFGFWLAVEETGDLLFRAVDAAPAWPREWCVCADRGADVNSWKGARDRANPDRPVLEISPRRPNLRRAYVHWPVPVFPPGIGPEEVTARIVLIRAYSRGDGKVWVWPVLSAWAPRSLSFAHQPNLGPPLPAKADVDAPEWAFAGPEVDAMVRAWVRGAEQEAFGVAVESDVEKYAAFYSDDTPQKAPRLCLELADGRAGSIRQSRFRHGTARE